jgi:hypothetical protein
MKTYFLTVSLLLMTAFLLANHNKFIIDESDELLAGEIGHSQTICYETIPDELIQIIAAEGGTGDYVYQWEDSEDGITFVEITGADEINFQPPSLFETSYYRRKVTDEVTIVYSNTVTITVYTSLSQGVISASQTI